MNSRAFAVVMLALLALGCDDDDKKSSSGRFLVAHATSPVPSPDPDVFLFSREGSGGGLFLWQAGMESRLSPAEHSAGGASWSDRDASWLTYAFAVPGEPGSSFAGIYVGVIGGTPERVWDQGYGPDLAPDASFLICSGSPLDSSTAGLWKIELPSRTRTRLTAAGMRPKLSPDGSSVAYLTATAASNGGVLQVKSLDGEQQRVVGSYVLDFDWLPQSGDLVYETASNNVSDVLPQTLYRVRAAGPPPGDTIVVGATHPRGVFPDHVLYSAVNADVLGALFVRSSGTNRRLSDTLFLAESFDALSILAVGASGISKVVL